jgi:hypothetical protein
LSDKKNGVEYFVCDAGHVHLSFYDGNGDVVFETAMDVDEWSDMVDEIDDEIEVMEAMEESAVSVKH